MERVARQYTDAPANILPTSYRAPLNEIGWARDLATAALKDMPTSNNDTFYMSAIVDLTEPYILSVPDANHRYYVVDVFNMRSGARALYRPPHDRNQEGGQFRACASRLERRTSWRASPGWT